MAEKLLVEGIENLVKDPKPLEDLSDELNAILPKWKALVSAGRVLEAVEQALVLEKKARLALDGATVGQISIFILNCHSKDVESLCDFVVLLSRRRGQLKRPVSEIVNLVSGWLGVGGEEMIGWTRDEKFRVIKCLTGVTEGKLFVEAERSRLRKLEANLLEQEGRVEEAAGILQDEQVEVVAGMGKREKTEYILEQMRLVLTQKDYIRLQIVSRKINPKLIDRDSELQDLKLRYYQYLVDFHTHENEYLNVAKCYQSIYNTQTVQENSIAWKEALESTLLFAILAPACEDQKALLEIYTIGAEKRKGEQIPEVLALVKSFLCKELISWGGEGPQLPGILLNHKIFKNLEFLTLVKKRATQHNLISVVSVFYTKATMAGLGQLLNLSPAELEKEISELASESKIIAKIDRPTGVVVFGRTLTPQQRLDIRASEIHQLLDLVESTAHLISKERMVHAAKSA